MSRIPRQSDWWLALPSIFMLAWGGNHFTPLLHLYEEVGHYAAWQANLLLGMYVAGLIPGLLLLAPISDQHGRKRAMIAGAVASLLGSILLGGGFDSFVMLCIGRVCAGIGVGAAMSVGTSWVKELSSPPFDSHAGTTAGARRALLTITGGFAVGALVTGLLAQWGPLPEVLPYAVHGLLTVIAIGFAVACPESLPVGRRSTESWWRDLRVPSAGHRRFLRLVMPAAPWIFAAAGVAYAIMPATVQERMGEWTTLYATLLTVVTLGAGALIQNLVPAVNRWSGGHAMVVGMGLMVLGMGLAAVAAVVRDPVLALLVALILGISYGICVTSGLIHVQTIATARDLAGLTGVYYSLAYSGFLLPSLLAAMLPMAGYPVTLIVVAVVCLGCAAAVARESFGWMLRSPRPMPE